MKLGVKNRKKAELVASAEQGRGVERVGLRVADFCCLLAPFHF